MTENEIEIMPWQMCCVCGTSKAQKQCAGCKFLFCDPCYETHIQDNKRFLSPDEQEVTPTKSK